MNHNQQTKLLTRDVYGCQNKVVRHRVKVNGLILQWLMEVNLVWMQKLWCKFVQIFCPQLLLVVH